MNKVSASFATYKIDLPTGLVCTSSHLRVLWGLPRSKRTIHFQELLQRIHPDDVQGFLKARSRAARDQKPYSVRYRIMPGGFEVRHVHAVGEFQYDLSGKAISNTGGIVDITAGIQSRQMALTHDKLTGLLDRSSFIEAIQRAVLHHQPDEQFAIVIFDIDRFAKINDTLGNSTGDILLKAIAARLTGHASNESAFARIGGDEFGCLVRHLRDDRDAISTTTLVLASALAPVWISVENIHVTASAGVAIFPNDGHDISLLEKAHIAQQSAKTIPQTSICRFEKSMDEALTSYCRLEADLATALERNEFELFYQPIVDGATLAVQSVEALLRWHHPRLGTITPVAFLEVAAETGVLSAIDKWAMQSACATLQQLRHTIPNLSLHVNVTASDIHHASFVEGVQSVLIETSLPASALTLEITEQALLTESSAEIATLRELAELGIRIALDDFGTLYSSLSYLKAFPIDEIKIDRSFVLDIEESTTSRALCRGLIGIARELGLAVTAEGVETQEQERVLSAMGCHALQGYRFGKPMPQAELMRWLVLAAPQTKFAFG